MLKMSAVSKIYRTGLVKTAALESLSLEVARGEFVSIMGPSGSGKTTLLNVAGLLDTFDGGRYMLDGVDVATLSDDEQSRLRNKSIGFIFQSFNLIPDLDAFDNVYAYTLVRLYVRLRADDIGISEDEMVLVTRRSVRA